MGKEGGSSCSQAKKKKPADELKKKPRELQGFQREVFRARKKNDTSKAQKDPATGWTNSTLKGKKRK